MKPIRVNDGLTFVPLKGRKKLGLKVLHPKGSGALEKPWDVVKKEECKPCPFCGREMIMTTLVIGIRQWQHPKGAECWFMNQTLMEGTIGLSLWNQRGEK